MNQREKNNLPTDSYILSTTYIHGLNFYYLNISYHKYSRFSNYEHKTGNNILLRKTLSAQDITEIALRY